MLKREAELVNVVHARPELLGIGIDDDAAIAVERDRLEAIGTGRVAIYDDVRRDRAWYDWLGSGDRFDLRTRRKLGP